MPANDNTRVWDTPVGSGAKREGDVLMIDFAGMPPGRLEALRGQLGVPAYP